MGWLPAHLKHGKSMAGTTERAARAWKGRQNLSRSTERTLLSARPGRGPPSEIELSRARAPFRKHCSLARGWGQRESPLSAKGRGVSGGREFCVSGFGGRCKSEEGLCAGRCRAR